MEQRRGREVERKGTEKSRKRVGERWGERLGEIRGTQGGEREGGRRAETWKENEKERGRDRVGGRDSGRQGEVEEDTGKCGGRNWGTQRLPEVRGTRVSMWSSQPSSSSIFVPWGFKEKEETAAGRRSWGGWPSQSSSLHSAETSPTHLPRMQQEVETLCSSSLGTPSMHREAGMSLVGRGRVFSMHCVIVLTCSVLLSKSLAFQKESHHPLQTQAEQIPGQYPLKLRTFPVSLCSSLANALDPELRFP